MPTVFLFFFFTLLFPVSLYGQESDKKIYSDESYKKEKTAYLKQQLELARQYKKDGDYLWAAKIVNYIVAESEDDDLSGEALFELIKVGDLVAKRFTMRNKTQQLMGTGHARVKEYEGVKGKYSDVWQELFAPVLWAENELLGKENLAVGMNHWGSDYHFDRTKMLSIISGSFPNTKWGESAYSGLIFGVYGNVDINQAHSFLERYPASEKRPWIYMVLGHAHTDQFKYTSDCDAEYAYGKESMDNAVKYYLLAEEAYLEIDDKKTAQDASKAAQDLIDGRCPDFLYYLVD